MRKRLILKPYCFLKTPTNESAKTGQILMKD